MITLRSQILLLLTATVLSIAIFIIGTSWINTSQYSQEQITRTIDIASDTFGQLLKSREEQLINSAELLTSDFGFKQAVATRDSATIDSALLNHGERVKADLMFLTSLAGRLVSSTNTALEIGKPFPHIELIDSAARQGGALSFVRVGDSLYQVVVVTVVAPVPIGFAGVGFKLNQAVADELQRLANVEVTFQVNGFDHIEFISTVTEEDVQAAISAPSDLTRGFSLPFGRSQRFITKSVELEGAEEDMGFAYLSVRLAPYLDEFARVRNEIFLISIVVMLISAAIATAFTRTITRPLDELVGIAHRIATGDFRNDETVINGASEIKSLFLAVNQMGRDISDREQTLQFQAEHDKLTSVLNRPTLVERLGTSLQQSDVPRLIACINIKGFRAVNDSLGPIVGDRVLELVATRLWNNTEQSQLVGRYGGDEFIIVTPLETGSDPVPTIAAAKSALLNTYRVGDLELNLAFTVGYALYPDDGTMADQLVRRAALAVDRGRVEKLDLRRYQAGEDEEYGHRLKLIRDLGTALRADDGQLFMNYQPKLNLSTGTIDKLEALIRWIHPEEGFVSPELFVGLAEQSGLIGEMTDWVVKSVIRERAAWQDAHPGLQVAINVSAQDLERDDLLPAALAQLKDNNLTVHSLCFEMTERDMMNDADKALELMLKYRDAGFDLSVDDYGIGQSSLSKLKQMPVSEIKIDKVFITHLEHNTEDQTIVNSTIKLGHDFNLRVIAEGVESLEATALLIGMGCDYIQGYYLAKPMRGEAFAAWMEAFEGNKRELFGDLVV